MDAALQIPIPRDVGLPLPADDGMLAALLVLLFLVHILFVNLMVGGSLLGVVFEAAGLRRRELDAVAREIAATITVNKSLAVVLGVGPLLVINVIYTVWFYSANALTGSAWLMVIPLVTAAFLLSYLWKYSWHALEDQKALHLGIGGLAALLFLAIPFIFLANINLMLFPARWAEVRGFLSAVLLPNVLVRYLHFLVASLAVSGLFFVLWFTRRGFPLEERLPGVGRAWLRRTFYGIAFGATLAQMIVGPTLYLTLPAQGMSWLLTLVIGLGVLLAVTALLLLWREVTRPGTGGRHYATIVGLITWTVFCMGYGRHLYREEAVADHRVRVAAATVEHQQRVVAAALGAGGASRKKDVGRQVFDQVCASCHALEEVLVGPSIREIVEVYAGNPEGIVAWVEAPGRKRMDLPPMPAFPLGNAKLTAVAETMFQMASGAAAEEEAPAEEEGPPAIPTTVVGDQG